MRCTDRPYDTRRFTSLHLHMLLQGGNLDPRELKRAQAAQSADFPDGIEQCGTDALRFALVSYTTQVGSQSVHLHCRMVGHWLMSVICISVHVCSPAKLGWHQATLEALLCSYPECRQLPPHLVYHFFPAVNLKQMSHFDRQGGDINLDIKKVVAYRHWCNKLWNAIKFAMKNLGDEFQPSPTHAAAGR